MATYCLKPIKGKVMRVVKLDACGTVVTGAKALVVSDGFVSIEQRLNYEDPDEYTVKNANGALCLNERSQPALKWIDLTMNFCAVDPEMVNIMTGSPLVLNDEAIPESVGFRTTEGVSGEFGLEVWTDLGGQTCVAGAKQYGYFLLPWVTEATVGDITIENGPMSFSLTGRTKAGSAWGTGPFYMRKLTGGVTSAKLATTIGALDHRHIQMTTLAPPTSVCGAQTLTPDV